MRRTFSTFALVAGLSIGLNPQARPDFSGTWTMDEARSESPTHEGFAGPVTWVIRQSPEELIVEVKRGPKTATFTYRIYPKAPAGPPARAGPRVQRLRRQRRPGHPLASLPIADIGRATGWSPKPRRTSRGKPSPLAKFACSNQAATRCESSGWFRSNTATR